MITITKKAADEILLSTHNPDAKGLIIRFAVEENPDGWQYLMGFDELRDDDIHLKSNGVEYLLAYSQKSQLDGMVVDFGEQEGGDYSFVFLNPNDPNYQPPTNYPAPKKNP